MKPRRIGPVHGRAAFTLIELLFVIVIVAVLAAILLSVFGRTTQQANIVKTMSNMKQMGVGMLLYANDNNFCLPNRVLDGTNDPGHPKWPVVLMPYLPDLRVYSSPIPDVNGKTYKVTDPTVFSQNGPNYTSYIYNGMNDIGAHTDSTVQIRLNTVGQASDTILLGIPYPLSNNYYMDLGDGDNNNVLNKKAFSVGSVYVFCDGSSRMLAYNQDSVAYNTQPPPSSGTYTDWLWLVDKTATSAIH